MGSHGKKYTPERPERQRTIGSNSPVPGVPRRFWTFVLFPAALLAIAAAVLIFWRQISPVFLSIDRFRDWIDGQGVFAPLLFVLAQCFQVIVFVIPGEVPQIAAGYLFGFWLGSLLSVAGILLGSVLSFLLARLLGVPFVLALFPRETVERVQRFARSSRALPLFFLVFLIPGIPKDVLCYAAGLTSIRLSAFMLVSTVARIPGIAGSALMGKAAAQERWLLVGIVFGVSLLLFLLGLLLRRRIEALLERLSSRGGRPDGRHPPGDAGDPRR